MAVQTLNKLYPTYDEAVQVVADLTTLGLAPGDVSLIESETDARLPADVARDEARNPAGSGATLGAAIGAGVGGLAGIGAITIPYTEPLVATGWILPLLAGAGIGAALGAVVGAVTRFGVAGQQAHALATGLQSGKRLVMVRVDEAFAAEVQGVLDRPHTLSPITTLPEPVFDEEPVAHPASTQAEVAAIQREERRIQSE